MIVSHIRDKTWPDLSSSWAKGESPIGANQTEQTIKASRQAPQQVKSKLVLHYGGPP